MARPPKDGLDYFFIDVDFHDVDPRLYSLAIHQGPKGIGVLVYLLTQIYRQGYYIHWTPENAMQFCGKYFIPEDQAQAVISELVEKGFFSKKLFEKYQVITSRGIQRRYLDACSRRKEVKIVRQFIVLREDELVYDNLIRVDINTINDDTYNKSIDVDSNRVDEDIKDSPETGQIVPPEVNGNNIPVNVGISEHERDYGIHDVDKNSINGSESTQRREEKRREEKIESKEEERREEKPRVQEKREISALSGTPVDPQPSQPETQKNTPHKTHDELIEERKRQMAKLRAQDPETFSKLDELKERGHLRTDEDREREAIMEENEPAPPAPAPGPDQGQPSPEPTPEDPEPAPQGPRVEPRLIPLDEETPEVNDDW